MRAIDLLTGPSAPDLWPGVIAAVAIALQCAALSVLIVPKKLAFLGQGISHAAFGGVGIAAILGVSAGPGFVIVAAFCVLAAIGVGALSGRNKLSYDSAIATLLVGSMALGAILLHIRLTNYGPTPMTGGWESLLFGSVRMVKPMDAALAWTAAAFTLGVLFWRWRPMLFWAYDEPAAETFGVSTGLMRITLLTLAAITIVVSMKLVGVVLVTALLVLPAATAMKLSKRLGAVTVLAAAIAEVGVVGGLALSFETDWPAGPCMVLALLALLAVAWATGSVKNRFLDGTGRKFLP